MAETTDTGTTQDTGVMPTTILTNAPGDASKQPQDAVVNKTEDAAGKQAEQVTDEGKGAEDKPSEGTKADTVPEAYELKAPEGMELDAKLIEQVSPVLKELKLSNEAAQKLSDAFAVYQKQQAEAQVNAFKETVSNWRKEITNDQEYGGKNYDATVKQAQSFVARFGDDQLRADLNTYGIGNLPSLIRALARAGKGMSEDSFHGTGGPAGLDSTPAEHRMFPSMAPKT